MAKPRRSWWQRLLLGFCACLLLLGLEQALEIVDEQRWPAPGRILTVGAARLHLWCTGAGSPTVVLEAGAGESSLHWAKVQPEVGRLTRVCSYDRAGLGYSTGAAASPAQVVEQLHALLQQAGEKGPFVLAGHSLGGEYVRLYADRYPDEVAGLTLVEARSEQLEELLPPDERGWRCPW